MNKIALTIVGTVIAALTVVACGSSPSARQTVVPTPTAVPSWASSYTPTQIADYEDALAAFAAIEIREAPIWSNPGHYTAASAGAIFRGDWSNANRPLHQLQSYIRNGIRVSGQPKVLSSRPGTVVSNSGGSGLEQITIRQCVDGSTVTATQNGRPLRPATAKRGVRVVEMFKTPGGQYLLFQVGEGPGAC